MREEGVNPPQELQMLRDLLDDTAGVSGPDEVGSCVF